ncbi:hypothetical protein LZ554_006716 [Drepanopeziza brunnea f. sp. 'monogermtubi']|nr:hypothetical protein LZ554_006716 [Drepanopeziza brunnea f. sp. 'monogermtubi']
MSLPEELETTDVVIVGCGPTGALLTALLGRFGVRNIVLEREAGVTNDPRGITLDEDGLRLLQEVGLYDKIYSEMGSLYFVFDSNLLTTGTVLSIDFVAIGKIHFMTSRNDLHERPFLKFDMDTSEGGTGHVGVIVHEQPVLEKHLRLAASRQPSSELRSCCTVFNIEEDAEWVYCSYRNASSEEKRLRARFLVGADGKTGFTRKMYLEPRGVIMEQAAAFGYNETWVALNLRITPPTPQSHPDLPFWQLGHTPEGVYDLYFPPNFRFICNDKRPVVCGRFGTGRERYWRLEFVVNSDEDAAEMATEKRTMEIVMPYLTHEGSKYNCPDKDIPFPTDCIEILRLRPFAFSARSCNKWAIGRVILAGDSAHVFPPFGGQGISSGFRDASGLAWRLALTTRERTPNHAQILAGWYRERQQQLRVSLARTIRNGSLCTQGNTWSFLVTKLLLRLMQLLPWANRALEKGPRSQGCVRYQPADGLPFLGDAYGGITLPQVYCAPTSTPAAATATAAAVAVQFSDDVIFATNKRGLFQLLVLVQSLADVDAARESLLDIDIDRLSNDYIRADEATFLVQQSELLIPPLDAHPPPPRQRDGTTTTTTTTTTAFRLATAEEFAACEALCRGRPKPRYYDMHRIGKDLGGMKFVVVRPDRFTYAACKNIEELGGICAGIGEKLGIV